MGDHGAVADAGETLVALLRDRMTGPVSEEQIALASPADEELRDRIRITLFLYDVDVSAHQVDGRRPTPADENPTRDPFRTDLKYLLTAHPASGDASTTSTAKTLEEHTVLGRAMQILRDNAIVDGPDLRGSLAEDDEALRISVLPEMTDTVANVWNTFEGVSYRPSMSYLVTPVEIESRHEESEERVEEIRIDQHMPSGDDSDG